MSALPEYLRWQVAFEVANACSWSAVLGAPLILMLKSQGASAAVLGVTLALPPLTMALQLVGACWLPRFGYRGMMVRGWTWRTVMIGLIGVVALAMPWLGPTVVIWMTLALFAVFNILRGLTSCAWMPWACQLVHEDQRARYLTRSGMLVQSSLIVCGLAYAAIFAVLPGPTGFAIIMAWGCLTGLVAAWFLGRIPDKPVEAEGGSGPVPWRIMLRHAPFARFLAFSVLVYGAFAACGVLWVPVMRDLYHQDDSVIAALPVCASIAQICLLPLLGPMVDRTGNRPMMAMAICIWVLQAGLWAGLAGGLLPLTWWVLALIQGSAGMGAAAYVVASQRMLMAIVPGQGRSHYFALNSLALAFGQGFAPVLWGLALDGLAGWHGWGLNAHAYLFLLSGALLVVAIVVSLRLDEPRALSTVEFCAELLVRSPRRALARLTGLGEGH